MKPIERLNQYLVFHSITTRLFEKTINLSNGYIKNKILNLGNISSHIILQINEHYPDLSIIWLITGRGEMILSKYFKKKIDLTNLIEANEEQTKNLLDLENVEPTFIQNLKEENELLKIQLNEFQILHDEMQCILKSILNVKKNNIEDFFKN